MQQKPYQKKYRGTSSMEPIMEVVHVKSLLNRMYGRSYKSITAANNLSNRSELKNLSSTLTALT